jgi:excisionase family DNA binding protein
MTTPPPQIASRQTRTDYLAYRDAAERCGISQRTIKRAAAAGDLKVVRFGHRTVRIEAAELERWIMSKKTWMQDLQY